MLVEDNSTKCTECGKPLVWVGRRVRGPEAGGLEEFRFACEMCKREYMYFDGRLTGKRKERDVYAESAAMARTEHDALLNHRCPVCGGPISDRSLGAMLACLWCGERYAVEKGELVPKLEIEHLLRQSRPRMRDFYALQPER